MNMANLGYIILIYLNRVRNEFLVTSIIMSFDHSMMFIDIQAILMDYERSIKSERPLPILVNAIVVTSMKVIHTWSAPY